MNSLWKSSIGAAVLAAAGILFVAKPHAQDGAGKPKPEEPKPAAPGKTDGDPALLRFGGESPAAQDAPGKPKPEEPKPAAPGKTDGDPALLRFGGGSPAAQDAPGKPKADEPKPAPGGKGGLSAPAPYLVEEDGRVKGSDWPVRFRTVADPNVQEKYSAAIAAYRAVPDGQDKESAKAAVRKQLAEIFEADMKSRKEQVDQIDARLKKLREQYQAREAAKDSIIDLQLQVLEKDANGLGFPGARAEENPNNVEGLRRYPLLPYPARLDKGQLLPGESANTPSATRKEHTVGTRMLPLVQLKKEQPVLVAELMKLGYFVESADGKFYVYANVNFPKGPSEIHWVDAETGRLLATSRQPAAVGKLEITEQGIKTQEGEGLVLRIPYGPPANNTLNPANAPPSETPAQGGVFGDYQSLRSQYLKAKGQLRSDEYMKSYLEQEKKNQGGDFTEEKMKSLVERLRNSAAKYQAQFDEASRLLDVKLNLLKLDVDGAMTALQDAELQLQNGQRMNSAKTKMISDAEIQSLMLRVKSAQVQLQRTKTMLQLFESIKDAPPAASSEASTPPSEDVPRVNAPSTETPAPGGALAEYQSFKSQYEKSKAQVVELKDYAIERVERARKESPPVTEEKVEKLRQELTANVIASEKAFQEATRLLDVKINLLKLDVAEAATKLSTAEARMQQAQEVGRINPGSVNLGEVDAWKSEAQAAKIQIERAQTMLRLFESIKETPKTEEDGAKRK